MKNRFNVIGLMSGTSLDGLDVAYTEYRLQDRSWKFSIRRAETIRYPKKWRDALATAHLLDAPDLLALHHAYGKLLGQLTTDFINRHGLSKPHFIASHGHTIFHQPGRGFTFQLGDANAIHAASILPVIADFRALDVALGGEGAPLVPIGDQLLFQDYDVCLNLGGIANLSRVNGKKREAFDICFCNMTLNYLMGLKGKPYDNRGETASRGTIDNQLLKAIQRVYIPLRKKRPSLGREIFEAAIKPLLDNRDISVEDKLATCVESTADEIVNAVSERNAGSLLCTGGGAFNAFLVSRMLDKIGDSTAIVVPDEEIVKFKEALVFGFLGVLRYLGKNNCLSSVTGAMRDSSSGVMIGIHY